MNETLRRGLPALALVLALPAAALAHRMVIDATVTATVRVVVGFDDDLPAEGATVTFTNSGGEVVGTGTADARGIVEFPRPPAGEYAVTAADGAGHRETVRLTIPETAGASSGSGRRNRWAMTAAGVAVIAAGTFAAKRLRRSPKPAASPDRSPPAPGR